MSGLFGGKPKKQVPQAEPVPKPEEKPPVEMPVDDLVERATKNTARKRASQSRRNRTTDSNLGSAPNTVMSDYRGGRR